MVHIYGINWSTSRYPTWWFFAISRSSPFPNIASLSNRWWCHKNTTLYCIHIIYQYPHKQYWWNIGMSSLNSSFVFDMEYIYEIKKSPWWYWTWYFIAISSKIHSIDIGYISSCNMNWYQAINISIMKIYQYRDINHQDIGGI